MDPIEYLLSLERLGMKFGLENMTRLCAVLRHPETSFRSVIVAGTNGKGSVSAMLSAGLNDAGHRVARYTSPHLERLEERFVIGEREVEPGQLREAARLVQQAADGLLAAGDLEHQPTFFECATAIAFVLFRQADVSVAVLEVGLGGRLDATNVVRPDVAVITSIDLDHQAQLGSTLASIAREKAGVIKPGTPVVCGPLPPEAEAVVAHVCREQGAGLVRSTDRVNLDVDVTDGRTIATFRTSKDAYDRVVLALTGRHQATNAATAITVFEVLADLGIRTNHSAVLTALTSARWPARLERFRCGSAEVLLDAAHNPAGARALADYLKESRPGKPTLVFGAMRDKDIGGMLSALAPSVSHVICTTARAPRAATAEEILAIARELQLDCTLEAIDDAAVALRHACTIAVTVVVAGSIFLIGPLRGILR